MLSTDYVNNYVLLGKLEIKLTATAKKAQYQLSEQGSPSEKLKIPHLHYEILSVTKLSKLPCSYVNKRFLTVNIQEQKLTWCKLSTLD